MIKGWNDCVALILLVKMRKLVSPKALGLIEKALRARALYWGTTSLAQQA
jgi:hypothetical protein